MNRLAIITGGTSGLGRALSLQLGKAGWTVVAVFHRNEEAAHQLEIDFEGAGMDGRTLKWDVRRAATDERLLKDVETAQALCFIHNAVAPFQPTPIHLLEAGEIRDQMDVALLGAHFGLQLVVKRMAKLKQGCFISVLSTSLQAPVPKGFAAYNAAKSALEGWTESMKVELGARGIQVRTFAPPFMETPLTESWHPDMKPVAVPVEKIASQILPLTEIAST